MALTLSPPAMMRGSGVPRHGGGTRGGGGVSCRGMLPYLVLLHLTASFAFFHYMTPKAPPEHAAGAAVPFPVRAQRKTAVSLAQPPRACRVPICHRIVSTVCHVTVSSILETL